MIHQAGRQEPASKFGNWWAPLYMAAIGSVELVLVFNIVLVGVLGHAMLAGLMLAHYALKHRESPSRCLPALAIAPLLRLLSLMIPVALIPEAYWPFVVGIPILAAVALAARLLDISPSAIGLRFTLGVRELAMGLSGIPLGALAYVMLDGTQPAVAASLDGPGGLALLAVAFVAVIEEIVFRGIILRTLTDQYGWSGVALSGALFGTMYVGTLSVEYVALMTCIGVGYAAYAYAARSLLGVIGSHVLVVTGLAFVWPGILG